jgi:hypothetical protein
MAPKADISIWTEGGHLNLAQAVRCNGHLEMSGSGSIEMSWLGVRGQALGASVEVPEPDHGTHTHNEHFHARAQPEDRRTRCSGSEARHGWLRRAHIRSPFSRCKR